MMSTQDVRFVGPVAEDPEYDHPPGMSLARRLHTELATRRWTVGEIDNWRDAGWEIPCDRDGARLVVVIATTMVDGEWYGQISPADMPGLIRRAFGRRDSATAADVYALAVDIEQLLVGFGFTRLRWASGYPEDDAPAKPVAPS
jgi:hypothetical protein